MWEGPYEIQRKLGDVTYELAIPGRRSGKRRVHVNMLKEWKQGVASICRTVVADERVEDVKDVTILGKSELTSVQQEQVQEILTDFSDLTNSETGTFANTEHGIVTGDAPPSRSHPYRIAPVWREQIHEEIKFLLEAGIIRHSYSPWSSSIVPVRKPDGSVRICIDFRKLNNVTVADPYVQSFGGAGRIFISLYR